MRGCTDDLAEACAGLAQAEGLAQRQLGQEKPLQDLGADKIVHVPTGNHFRDLQQTGTDGGCGQSCITQVSR